MGFDPRTLHCLRLFHKYIKTNQIDYKIIKYDDQFTTIDKLNNLLKKNELSLKQMLNKKAYTSTIIHMMTNNEI